METVNIMDVGKKGYVYGLMEDNLKYLCRIYWYSGPKGEGGTLVSHKKGDHKLYKKQILPLELQFAPRGTVFEGVVNIQKDGSWKWKKLTIEDRIVDLDEHPNQLHNRFWRRAYRNWKKREIKD